MLCQQQITFKYNVFHFTCRNNKRRQIAGLVFIGGKMISFIHTNNNLQDKKYFTKRIALEETNKSVLLILISATEISKSYDCDLYLFPHFTLSRDQKN